MQAQGIHIFPHGKYQVKAEDAVIYSSATEGSVEVQEAMRLKKEAHTPLLMWDYFAFLGEMSKYFITVGFTGTNGKSSSSAMAITVAKELLPNFGIGIVGALVPDFGGKSYVISPFLKGGEGGAVKTRKHYIDYEPSLKELAKNLRNTMTQAEKNLRYHFLSPCKYKFLRQKPI
ncbi:MAG: hypothetical protein LBU27_08150 [Candidatus Peribacteria bacterium]|nr:hypothetical protein [Candidatus Peribacteria bacterium]